MVIPGAEEGNVCRSRARMAYRAESGALLHLGVGAYALRDDEGERAGYILIFQDVTEVVEMEGDLRRSERLAAVGELSASIAHEIRNPLAAISGSIEMLQAQRRDPSGTGATCSFNLETKDVCAITELRQIRFPIKLLSYICLNEEFV